MEGLLVIIHIEICDHCGNPARGFTMESYRVGKEPTREICSVCQDKPFKSKVEPHPRAVAIQSAVRLLLGAT